MFSSDRCKNIYFAKWDTACVVECASAVGNGCKCIYGSIGIITDSLIGAFSMLIVFLIIYYISRRTLGGGDVKLSFVLGFALTITMVFTAVFYALLFCGIFAIVAIALKKLNRKSPLPLGPFLFLGTVVVYFLYV